MNELTAGDIRRLCGDIVDWKIVRMLETGAEVRDLEVALAFAAGESDVLAKERVPLTGDAGALYDILTADEDAYEEDERSA